MNISSIRQFRTMTTADIQRGLELCRVARWNQLARDWEMFLRLNPSGCCVALLENQVVGTVTTVRHEARFAWIGMVLVDPAARGQGIGTQLLQQALELLSDIPSIRLDATPAGHPLYCQLGFQDEYGLSRMERVAAPLHDWEQPTAARPMQAEDLPAVAVMDREIFGADRRITLEWLFEGAPEYAWVLAQQNEIVGYSFGRHGFAFEHLGPIVAHDPQLARQLVAACLQQQTHKPFAPFVIDAPEHSAEWRAWLEAIGFREQRPFIRMFYRANPFPGLPQNQFGILGPEFG